jgi:DNA-binding response OmpR family regulator
MRVLLVEDDDILRPLIARVIRNAGHEVVMAGSADEAVNHLSHEQEGFHVLIADFGLPGTNGCRLIRKGWARWPHLRVLLLSGWPQEDLTDKACRGLPLLQKPFALAELEQRLKRLAEIVAA